jgi:tetratricopeptide (TPR) repeat protein
MSVFVKTQTPIIRILPLAIAAALASPATAQTQAVSSMNQAEAFYRQGIAAEKAGDPDAARQAYLRALKADSRHANARFSLGQLKLTSAAIAVKGREAKFAAVIVPEIKLDEASLKESLDALQIIVEKQSKDQVTPNFVVNDPQNTLAGAKISLVLKNMPAKSVLQYLLDQSGARARFDEHAIVIQPN